MLIKRPRSWEMPEALATPEEVYLNRRHFMGGVATAGAALLVGCGRAEEAEAQQAEADEPEAASAAPTSDTSDLYPAPRNAAFTLDREVTDEELATTYNNFYEFGSHKRIWRNAQALPLSPWDVTIDGMVEQERTISFYDLVRQMPLEERLYRHRCVEAWAMAVPWSGFPLAALVAWARPLTSARYLRMETFQNRDVASGQRAPGYPWPYVEGLTMAEATNDLAFIATGIYGREMPPQNGAPLRLAVPWKYGFKSIKSIVRFTFTDQRPLTFWENVGPSEYGFWANVNPDVPHRRWSQATEELLGV
jgi:sulfoxide reductase catalytic subunit YedY